MMTKCLGNRVGMAFSRYLTSVTWLIAVPAAAGFACTLMGIRYFNAVSTSHKTPKNTQDGQAAAASGRCQFMIYWRYLCSSSSSSLSTTKVQNIFLLSSHDHGTPHTTKSTDVKRKKTLVENKDPIFSLSLPTYTIQAGSAPHIKYIQYYYNDM